VLVDAKLAEQKSKSHQWKFLNTAHQTQSIAMTAGNIYPIQLVSLNGLVPFAWFIMPRSTTSAGLTTGMQLTTFEWGNQFLISHSFLEDVTSQMSQLKVYLAVSLPH